MYGEGWHGEGGKGGATGVVRGAAGMAVGMAAGTTARWAAATLDGEQQRSDSFHRTQLPRATSQEHRHRLCVPILDGHVQRGRPVCSLRVLHRVKAARL